MRVRQPFDSEGVDDGVTGTCFCCAGKSTAAWCGESGTVEVCRDCALVALPSLIADAVFQEFPHNSMQMAKDAFQKLEARF